MKQYHNASKSFVFLQETHSVPADETKWQAEWGLRIMFDHGSANKADVAIMFPLDNNGDDARMITQNGNGRKLGVSIKLNNTEYFLLNVYGPTQDKKDEQVKFLDSLKDVFESKRDQID